MQSADKQQWPHAPTVGPVVLQGRRHGGSVHGSEMEISQAIARDCPALTRHVSIMSENVISTGCASCEAIHMSMCDCRNPQPRELLVRRGVLQHELVNLAVELSGGMPAYQDEDDDPPVAGSRTSAASSASKAMLRLHLQ